MRLKLQYCRLLKGYSKNEIAEKVGVVMTTYNSYETGRYTPCVTRVNSLSKLLNCSLEDVLQDMPQTEKNIAIKKKLNKAERLYRKKIQSHKEFMDFLNIVLQEVPRL